MREESDPQIRRSQNCYQTGLGRVSYCRIHNVAMKNLRLEILDIDRDMPIRSSCNAKKLP